MNLALWTGCETFPFIPAVRAVLSTPLAFPFMERLRRVLELIAIHYPKSSPFMVKIGGGRVLQ